MKVGSFLNKILYHIHRKNCNNELWQVGNEFVVGNENNKFVDYSFNFDSLILIGDKKYPFKNIYVHYDKIEDKIKLLDIANNIIKEYQILIRELGMEEIRKKFYPNLPSRQKCIFLCGKKQIEHWKKEISNGDGTKDIEVFKVEIFNEPFKSRDSFLPLPSDSYNTILKKAKLYWSAKDDSENEDDEYLYVGEIRVINKVS